MKRRMRPPSLSNACATCEVAWEPSSRAANWCIERTCPQPFQRSKPNANPSPDLMTSKLSRFKCHKAAA
jgi:hypothetical protein